MSLLAYGVELEDHPSQPVMDGIDSFLRIVLPLPGLGTQFLVFALVAECYFPRRHAMTSNHLPIFLADRAFL